MRKPRMHVAGGLYYVVLSPIIQPLFFAETDYRQFLKVLSACSKRSGARTIAYCLLESAAHIAVELGTSTAANFLHDFTQHYAHGAIVRREPPIRFRRHRILLVDPEYRLALIRFVHWRAIESGQAPELNGYPHTSHRTYLGQDDKPWIDPLPVLHELNPRLGIARREYETFALEPPTIAQSYGFTHGLRRESRVFATPAYLRRIGLCAGLGLTHSLETVTDLIRRYRGVTVDELLNSRSCAVERALVAWYAEERKIATLSEVASYLKKHHSTLRWGVNHYRETMPDVFDLRTVHRLTSFPLQQLVSGKGHRTN